MRNNSHWTGGTFNLLLCFPTCLKMSNIYLQPLFTCCIHKSYNQLAVEYLCKITVLLKVGLMYFPADVRGFTSFYWTNIHSSTLEKIQVYFSCKQCWLKYFYKIFGDALHRRNCDQYIHARPQAITRYILVSNTESKDTFCY